MKKILLMNVVFLSLVVSQAWGQDRMISGKVTAAEDGSALPGVNVSVKGTPTGTATSSDGSYQLNAPSTGTLVFSFIGLISQEVAIGNQTVINAIMKSDVKQLSEVVVTGVGVATDKRKLGISVEAISAKNLPQTPSASIDQALIGKIPGAQISSTNGTPGADVNILLRGINTINRGTSPMILIDGIQVAATNLNTIDLNTIERVEVVQGAASATIYGAQGANGVIQLFTKKGKNGQLNIDISSSITENTYLNVGNLHKASHHAFVTDADNNVIGTSGNPLTFDPEVGYTENVRYNALDITSKADKPYDRNLKYYDHFDLLFQPSRTFNNSVSVSGGKEKLDFSFSVSNNSQESNIVNNGGLNRTNLSANIGIELAKNLRFRSTTQLAYTKNTVKVRDRDIIYSIFNSRPFADYNFKDPDGNYVPYYGDAVGVNGLNPNYYLQYRNASDNKVDIIQNLNLNYKINKFLELDAKYGINYQNQKQVYTYLNQTENKNSNATASWIYDFNDAENTGEISNWTFDKTFQNFKATATLYTDFEEDFHWNIPIKSTTQVALDWRNTNYQQYITYALGLPTYTPYKSGQAATFKVPAANLNRTDALQYADGDYSEPFVTYGYLVNQHFEFGEVAGISGGFRSDYSSAYGRGSTPFTFPRGDAYFRVSALNLWKDGAIGAVFPELKFRAAYGEAGIQPKPFDRYVTLGPRTLGTSNSFYFNPAQNNPNLGVEVSKELEIGTDLSFNLLKGSSWLSTLNVSATYWDRKTEDAIYNVDAAPSSGVGTLKTNAFSLASHGIQASLNATVFHNENFNWNLTTNFGKQTSEITAVQGNGEIVLLSSAGSTNYVLKAGDKVGQLYGNKILHQVNEKAPDGSFLIPEDQQSSYEVANNGYVVSKATKQPFYSEKKYSFGDPNPRFNMSFINDITFKNFLTFSFQFDWVNGSHLYNQTKEWMYRDGIHSDYENPLTINGETGAWTAFYRGNYTQRGNNGTKDYFYEDASYLRLRNVALGVDFAKLFKIPAFKRLQLVLSGRNLLTFTDYTGMDPEVSSGTVNSAWDRGTDHNTMPNYRSYQVGLNIGF